MSRPLLILRPEPGASATAARAGAGGHVAVVAPLFAVRPVAWSPPGPAGFDAVIATSANALRHAGAALARLVHLPLYAVGEATAAAGRAAGFTDVRAGDADAAALADLMVRDGMCRALHLAGREHRPLSGAGLSVDTRIVYAAEAVSALPEGAERALRDGAVALVHSPRAGRLFRTLIEAAGIDIGTVRLAAISAAALEAAGTGWAATAIAVRPTGQALLAAAARLCDQSGGKDG